MDVIEQVTDHPIVLLVAFLCSIPVLVQLWKAWFPDIEEDLVDSIPSGLLNALGAPGTSWLALKIACFIVSAVAVTICFAKLFIWLLGL